MTTSIDVLAYLHSGRFSTMGILQRQKLLYYAQAWHLTWFGRPLFRDPIRAWRNGPVVEAAWRLDKSWNGGLMDAPRLSEAEQRTVDSIVDFYGRMNGSQLSDLTHTESPWVTNYVHVSPLMRGSAEINQSVMRTFYTEQALSGVPCPQKPATQIEALDDEAFDAIVNSELDRWSGTLRLLADR